MVADLDIYRTAKVLIDPFEEMASVGAKKWADVALARGAPICAQGFPADKEGPDRDR